MSHGKQILFFKVEHRFEETGSPTFWLDLYRLVKKRKEEMPEGSYTSKLFREGKGKIAKKFGEEAVEVVTGYLQNDKENLVWEIADMIYHLTVLMVDAGVTIQDVMKELEKRRK